jgi:cytoskeletal protein RodZ
VVSRKVYRAKAHCGGLFISAQYIKPTGKGDNLMSDQQQKKSWFKRHKILTAIIALLALIAVINLWYLAIAALIITYFLPKRMVGDKIERVRVKFRRFLNSKKTRQFLHSNPATIALLILFFPIGIYLMWRYMDWGKVPKFVISGIGTVGIAGVFILAVLFAPPTIKVTSALTPQSDDSYRLTGQVLPDNSKVTVDGKFATVNGDKFSASLKLSEGDNKITIVARSSNNRVTQQVITLHRYTAAEIAQQKQDAAQQKADELAQQQQDAADQKAQADAQAKAKAGNKAKAIDLLATSTNFYLSLLQQGQEAIGTQQYPDATTALYALNNDNTSPASKLSNFNSQFANNSYDSYKKALDAADKLYYHGATPDALVGWKLDMGQADGDLRLWGTEASSWQIQEISSAQLDVFTQRVQKGLANALGDITDLKNAP